MEVIAGFLIAFAFLTTLHPLQDVPDTQVDIHQQLTKGMRQTLKHDVKPFSSFRDENIVKQQFDYSCGSAALATLLNAYLGEKLTEEQVVQGMMTYGDSSLIEERRAFSLLDMKQFASVLGYKGAGYTAELEDLKALDKPCIVPIEFYGYKHFVVYRGMYGSHMFFADPFMGNISFNVDEFKSMWHKNIIFLVTSEDVTFNALRLRDEDLRLVNFGSKEDFLPQIGRQEIVDAQQRLRESIGGNGPGNEREYQYFKYYIK